ncbi:MAG: hypothetical protein HY763_08155 [Planctomycetes bacterium]|nr:hypothetical protein [Planctomycetota bacterium]
MRITARSGGLRYWIGSCGARRMVQAPAGMLAAVVLALPVGCAALHRETPAFSDTWDPGLEIRFPSAMPTAEPAPDEAADADALPPNGEAPAGEEPSDTGAAPAFAQMGVVAAPDRPEPVVHRVMRDVAAVAVVMFDRLGLGWRSRNLLGIPDYQDTKYTLIPGNYMFQYECLGAAPVFGQIDFFPVMTPRAREFIRHASISITPGTGGGASVLSEAEIDQARAGDVVTKVVFMADLRAVRDRLDKIERGLRELDKLRVSLQEQEAYWNRKLTERRTNSRYSAEFGWGVDVPSWDMALLQSFVGAERYHWHRFSEAEDQVRTYERKLAELDLPQRRLLEEREALKQLFAAADVMYRSEDLLLLSPSMIRPHHDPVEEVASVRGGDVWADYYRGKIMFEGDDWVGAWGKVHFPYWYSSLAHGGLAPGLRPIVAPQATATKPVGEVLLVVQAGARRPIQLGGDSWVSNP